MNKIKEAYYNTKTGFRGKSAIKKDGVKNVNDAGIDEFYDKNQSTQVFNRLREKPTLFPIIASKINHVMEMDLMDFSKNPDTNYRYMVICIDDFSKYVYGYPIKDKAMIEVAFAMEDILKANKRRTGGVPDIILSDAEPSMYAFYMANVADIFGVNIKARPGIHAPCVERVIGTLKSRLERYSVATNTKNWVKPLADLISGYNGIANVSGYSPKDVDKHEDEIKWLNTFKRAQILKNIDPDRLDVGDSIRLKLKPAMRKGTKSYYSTETYKVVKKSGNSVVLENGKKINSGDAVVVPDGTDVSGLRRSERLTGRVEEQRVLQ